MQDFYALPTQPAGPDLSAGFLLDALPWGLLVPSPQGVRRLNHRAAAWWGLVPAAGPGRSGQQLGASTLPEPVYAAGLKHAQATAATLEVEVLPAWVVLRVEDNGRGFDPGRTSDGLGLRSRRSRVALLGGSVHLTTAPGGVTQCQIRLSLPPASP